MKLRKKKSNPQTNFETIHILLVKGSPFWTAHIFHIEPSGLLFSF